VILGREGLLVWVGRCIEEEVMIPLVVVVLHSKLAFRFWIWAVVDRFTSHSINDNQNNHNMGMHFGYIQEVRSIYHALFKISASSSQASWLFPLTHVSISLVFCLHARVRSLSAQALLSSRA
jgi:hypothetical protein